MTSITEQLYTLLMTCAYCSIYYSVIGCLYGKFGTGTWGMMMLNSNSWIYVDFKMAFGASIYIFLYNKCPEIIVLNMLSLAHYNTTSLIIHWNGTRKNSGNYKAQNSNKTVLIHLTTKITEHSGMCFLMLGLRKLLCTSFLQLLLV